MKESFLFHTILMIFAGIGVWLILTKKLSDNVTIIKNSNSTLRTLMPSTMEKPATKLIGHLETRCHCH